MKILDIFEGWQDKFAPIANEIAAGMTVKDLVARLDKMRIGLDLKKNPNVGNTDQHVITSAGFTTVRGKPTIRFISNQDLEYATVIKDVHGFEDSLRHELSHYMQQNGTNPMPAELTRTPIDFNDDFAGYFLSPVERPAQALDAALILNKFDIDPNKFFSLFVKKYEGTGESVNDYMTSIEPEVEADILALAYNATVRDIMKIRNHVAAYSAMRQINKQEGSKEKLNAYKRTVRSQLKKARSVK